MKKEAPAPAEQPKRKPGRPKKETAAASTPKITRTRTKKATPPAETLPDPQELITASQEAKARKNGKVFSVWLQDEDIESLQLYADVVKLPITAIVTNALRKYLAENRPTEEEKAAYFAELDSIKDKVQYL